MRLAGLRPGNIAPPALICLLSIIGCTTAQSQNAPSPQELAEMKKQYRRPARPPIQNQELVELGRSLSIAKAIAAFERTLEPGIAPFDRWVEGDEQAISDSAKRGVALFNGKAACFACHSGWRFTDDRFHDIGTTTTDLGRGRVVKDDELMQFAFKTPTLRAVALRPPYMHTGSQATLHRVMKHYENGGIAHASRSPLMMPIELADQERRDVIALLETLTDDAHTGRKRADE